MFFLPWVWTKIQKIITSKLSIRSSHLSCEALRGQIHKFVWTSCRHVKIGMSGSIPSPHPIQSRPSLQQDLVWLFLSCISPSSHKPTSAGSHPHQTLSKGLLRGGRLYWTCVWEKPRWPRANLIKLSPPLKKSFSSIWLENKILLHDPDWLTWGSRVSARPHPLLPPGF